MCSDSNCYVEFFKIYYFFYAIFGANFQLFLVFLIYKKSPATLNSLKIFLYNTAFVQLALVIFSFCSQHRLVFNRMSIAVLNTGPCRFIGSWMCFANYHAFQSSSLLAGSAISITVLFRFLVLIQNHVSSNQRYFMIAATYIAPLTVLIIPFTENWNFHSVQLESKNEHPNYDFSPYPNFPGFSNLASWQYLSATLILTVGAYGIPICCLFLTKKVLKLINQHSKMSEKTKKQARTLVHGLIVQSAVPFISYIPMFSCYVYIQITGSEILISEHLMLASSAFPGLIDPFVSFYFIIPYRQAILKWIIRKRETQMVFTMSNSISNNN